jgi:hypothetical protein
MKRPLPADINYELLPEHLRAGMRRWIEDGILPGDFLQACLRNDLFQAVSRDSEYGSVPAVVMFLYNEAPASSWGSQEKMDAWIAERKPPETFTPSEALALAVGVGILLGMDEKK